MKQLLYLTIISLIVLNLVSCNKNQHQYTIEPVKIYEDSLIPSFFDGPFLNQMKYKYVKLQTTEECLITSISKIKRDDSLLFIMDSKQHLFVFNTKGDYLRTIGEKGGSKSEYVSMFDFFLKKEDKEIGIIDRSSCDYLLYDYEGNFIGRKALSREPFTSTAHCELLNNKFIFRNYYYSGNPFNYTIFDSNEKTTTNVFPYLVAPDEAIFWGKNGDICNLGNRLLCRVLFSDTIFQFTGNGFEPAFEIITHNKKRCTKSNLEHFKQEDLFDWHKIHKTTNKSIGITKLFCTDSLIVFNFFSDGSHKRGCYDIKTKKGKVDTEFDFRHNIIYSDESCFISIIDDQQSIKANQEIPDGLKKLLAETKESDNPILVIME